jgi:hypothetical protein
LQKAIIPYYLRQVEDVVDAFHHANQALKDENGATGANNNNNNNAPPPPPPPQLELINVRNDVVLAGGYKGDLDVLTANLFWSIYAGCIRAAGLLPSEEIYLQQQIHTLFLELFEDGRGVYGHFIAATVRRIQ